jgi:hypothetical protein
MYVTVYNELVKAYTILRNRESERRYNESYETCTCVTKNGQKRKRNPEYEKTRKKVEEIRDLYPLKLSEAEPQQGDNYVKV